MVLAQFLPNGAKHLFEIPKANNFAKTTLLPTTIKPPNA